MKAQQEVDRLIEKLNDGTLHPDEPLFVLRAQDICAANAVRDWANRAVIMGARTDKIEEADVLADEMDEWPIKQIPGRPETRKNSEEQEDE